MRGIGTEHAEAPIAAGLAGKRVLVAGLGASGQAACSLLLRRRARVSAVDRGRGPKLMETADVLRRQGVAVHLGCEGVPAGDFDLAVVSPGISAKSGVRSSLAQRSVPVVGELEFGYWHSRCLNVGITGTNGKTTTTELVERLLRSNQRRALAAGNIGCPLCSVADQTKDLDFLVLEISSFQLETIRYYRPVVAVFLNLTPDHLDRYGGIAEYLSAKARIFMNQQPFDWAIIQSEALAQLRAQGVVLSSKVLTFSANNRDADLYWDRGLLVSTLPGWAGPLLDMADLSLPGRHNAENVMAALAVGRVLRLPLEGMVAALKGYRPGPHRCEKVAEVDGVSFVNDSKATNVDAMQRAILAMPSYRGEERNVWLIAGGQDKGFDFGEAGPLLSRRVKNVFLLGETRERLRSAWSPFTPCTLVDSLLEAVFEAARGAVFGDVILLSPSCSSFDMFQNYQHRGDVFRQAVQEWKRQTNCFPATSIRGGSVNLNGTRPSQDENSDRNGGRRGNSETMPDDPSIPCCNQRRPIEPQENR